jgi:tetratricopeptide (TPR) repeat protein
MLLTDQAVREMEMKFSCLRACCLLFCIFIVTGCSGPEEKKMTFFSKGKSLYEKGELVKAGLELKNAIQIDPKFTEAYYMLGMVELRRGNLKNAYGNLLKSTELNPDHQKAQIQLGKIFLAGGASDKALEKADLVLKREPKNEEALLLKAAVFLARKDIDKAGSILRWMIGEGMTKPDVFILLASTFITNYDKADLERVLHEGIKANPRSIVLNLAIAEFYAGTGRVNEAETYVRQVISLEPEALRHRFTLAGLYWRSGREEKAVGVLKGLVASAPKDETRRIQVARFYVAMKKFRDAEMELKSGIAQIPKSTKLRFALGDLYLNLNMSQRAFGVLKEVLSLSGDSGNPDMIRARNALAKICLMRREVAEAVKYVDQVLKENPRDVDAHFTKGDILLLKGDGPGAVAEFRSVVNEKPQFAPGYVRLAEAHMKSGEMNLAYDTLQNALKIDKKSRDIRMALARWHIVNKKYGNAEKMLRGILADNTRDLEVKAALGDTLLAAGNSKGAEAEYADIRRNAPKVSLGYVKLAELYQRQGEGEKAISEMEQAVKLNPSSDRVLSSLIGLYMDHREYAKGVALCEARIAKNPGDVRSCNLLGRLYAARGDYRKAEETLRKAIASRPDHMDSYMSLGRVYVQEKENRKAIQVYETALGRQPDFWAAANDLACLISETATSEKGLDKALNLAQKAQAIRPEEPTVWDTLGWIYYKKGDMKKSVDLISRVHSRLPESPVINYHMGMAFYKDGKRDKAKECLRKSLQGDEDFPGREEAVRTLQALL